MIKAVLFDLDGTLVNSLSDLAKSTNYAIGKFGFKPHDEESFKYFVGDGMSKMIERALPKDQNDAQTVSKIMPVFLEYYEKHFCDQTTAYTGMKELIDTLISRGILVAVVTNKAQKMAEMVINKIYGNRFSLIVGNRPGVAAKPDPAATIMAMNMLKASPEECIFVGDSRMDVETGVNSGAFPVGVLWGFRKYEELINGGAKTVINKPEELLAIIDNLS